MRSMASRPSPEAPNTVLAYGATESAISTFLASPTMKRMKPAFQSSSVTERLSSCVAMV